MGDIRRWGDPPAGGTVRATVERVRVRKKAGAFFFGSAAAVAVKIGYVYASTIHLPACEYFGEQIERFGPGRHEFSIFFLGS